MWSSAVSFVYISNAECKLLLSSLESPLASRHPLFRYLRLENYTQVVDRVLAPLLLVYPVSYAEE